MYLETRQTVVRTPFQRLTIRLVDDQDKRINQNKQYRGLPPNWVHSLDACHMMGTTLRMKDYGLTMAEVHDEFSTHACDVPQLQTCLRQEFVEMHSRDLLTEFKVEVEKQLEVELPAPPTRGSLDINQIMHSTYFFS
jgi:DNA-directed RNA polymerase, mitochondrial